MNWAAQKAQSSPVNTVHVTGAGRGAVQMDVLRVQRALIVFVMGAVHAVVNAGSRLDL